MKFSLKKTGPWWILPILIGLGLTVAFILFGDMSQTMDFVYTVF
jgi:hypothetical protein